jgi:ferritin-like metal-binding protein YciE
MPELQELLTEECRDLYDAEKQLTKALPRMARAVTTPELKQAILEHTEVTKNQVTRLEQVFEHLGVKPKGKPCRAMRGLVEEGQEHIQEHEKGLMLDSVIIAGSQKIEHYEIAGYGTARAIAKSCGLRDVMNLLAETLKEEEQTDKNLTTLGLQIQKAALQAEGQRGREDVQGDITTSGRGRASKKTGSRGAAKKKVAAASGAGTRVSAKTSSNGTGRGAQKRSGRGGTTAGSQVSTDHDEIRRWAEERGAHPACVKGTGGKSDTGMIRLDFPGYTGGESLQEITWDEFFQQFDQQNLALLYQEQTAGGQKSNFNKLIGRETARLRDEGDPTASRRTARSGSKSGRSRTRR